MSSAPIAFSVFVAACSGAAPADSWLEAIRAADKMSAEGDLRGAESKLREALKWAEMIDRKGANTGVTWNNLGLVRQYMGDAGQAESCFLRSRDIFRKLPGPTARLVSRPSNNLATLYLDEGRPEKLAKLDLEGLVERLRQEEPNYPDLAITMENLAGMYFLDNRVEAADELYGQVLEIRARAEGPDSTAAAVVMHNLAAVRVRQNRLEEAEQYLLKCFRIWDVHPEFQSSNLVLARSNLGLIYALTGREQDSVRQYEDAIRSAVQLLGPEHRRTADVYNSYALALRSMKRKKEAGRMEEQARKIRENTPALSVGSTVSYSDLLPRSSPRP